MLNEAATTFTPDETGIRTVLDHMLDFYLDHVPEMSLWQHRYFHDAADIVDIDTTYRAPIFQRLAEIAGPEIASRTDIRMLLSIVSWSFRGFLSGGPPPRRSPPRGRLTRIRRLTIFYVH